MTAIATANDEYLVFAGLQSSGDPSQDKDGPLISNDENRSTTNFQYKDSITDAVHTLLDYSLVSKLKEGS